MNDDFSAVLDVGIRSGKLIGDVRTSAWSGPVGIEAAEISLIQAAESGFGTMGIVVKNHSGKYLHTAFPVATKGNVHPIRVLSVQESSFGLEARVTAELGEATITFFEPFYTLNAARYRPGAEMEVALAGIAYHLEVADPKGTVVHPELGEIHLRGAAALLSMRDSDPGNLPNNGFGLAYILEPSKRPGPDDYSFRGPVKNIQSVDFLTRPAQCVTTTLLRIDGGDQDIDVNLFVLNENIRAGRKPRIGEDISGVLWLQGFANSA